MTAAYDASGNQLHWGSTAYSWDPLNNLKTFNNSKDHRTFLYNADDERIWTSDFTNTESFDTWTFTLRGLDNKVLTVYETKGNNPNTDGQWRAHFTDILDEVDGWNAQLRQAPRRDLVGRSKLRHFSNSRNKASSLVRNGYPGYRERPRIRSNAPQVGGREPGDLVNTATWFFKIPR